MFTRRRVSLTRARYARSARARARVGSQTHFDSHTHTLLALTHSRRPRRRPRWTATTGLTRGLTPDSRRPRRRPRRTPSALSLRRTRAVLDSRRPRQRPRWTPSALRPRRLAPTTGLAPSSAAPPIWGLESAGTHRAARGTLSKRLVCGGSGTLPLTHAQKTALWTPTGFGVFDSAPKSPPEPDSAARAPDSRRPRQRPRWTPSALRPRPQPDSATRARTHVPRIGVRGRLHRLSIARADSRRTRALESQPDSHNRTHAVQRGPADLGVGVARNPPRGARNAIKAARWGCSGTYPLPTLKKKGNYIQS